MRVSVEAVMDIIKNSENLAINPEELVVDKPLHDQGIDSLDLMSIVLNIEEAFGLKIPDDEVAELISVEKIVEYLKIKLPA